jgi:vitamin B12 transporter
VSVTGFYNRFSDLLVFEFIDAVNGAYENVDSAETAGVEVAAEADILPGLLRGGVSYTYLYSRNLETGRTLPRRPEHSAAFDLTLIGSDRFEMTLSGILVGERFNTSSAATPLPSYGRLDLSANYVLCEGTELLARIENLTDVEYQDPSGFNAPGLSGYVGLSWAY